MANRKSRRTLAFRLLALLDKVLPSRGLPIALYHQVAETPTGYRIGGHVSPQVFRQQMVRLAQRGYRGISIGDYMNLRRDNQPLPSRVLGLTFDDGQEDVYRFAFPVLAELGFSATIYVVTDYVGQEKWFDPETNAWSDDQPHQSALFYRFMDWDQAGEMQAAGFEFGAHTRSHPWLTDLPAGAIEEEVAGSKAALEQVLGEPVRTFCYPFGQFDQTVRQVVAGAGYQAACGTTHGLNRADTDPFDLRRYGIASVTGPAFDVYLTGKYAWYYRQGQRRRGKA